MGRQLLSNYAQIKALSGYSLDGGDVLSGTVANDRTTGTSSATGSTLVLRDLLGDTAVRNLAAVAIAAATLAGQLTAVAATASQVPGVFKGAALQSAALTQWQNSSGSVLSSVDASGRFVGDGSLLTSLQTSQLTGGVIDPSLLGNNYSGGGGQFLRDDGYYSNEITGDLYVDGNLWGSYFGGTSEYANNANYANEANYADNFYGSIDGSQVGSGTISASRLPATILYTTGTQTATGAKTFSGGISAPAAGSNSECYGSGASTGTTTQSLAIGKSASVAVQASTAIGYGATVTAGGDGFGTAIGRNASAYGHYCVAIGANCVVSDYASTAIGAQSSVTGPQGLAIGNGVTTGGNGIILGAASTATGNAAISIGKNNTASAQGSITIGNGCVTNNQGDVVLGFGFGNTVMPSQLRLIGSTTTAAVELAELRQSFIVSTHATRQIRSIWGAHNFNGFCPGIQLDAPSSGTQALIAFLGNAAVARQSVGSAATDAASTQTLANNLRSALIALGLCST